METQNIKPIVEAILFSSDAPVPLEKLRSIIETAGTRQIQESIKLLNGEYGAEGRSFHIIEVAGGFQFATHPRYASWIKKLFRGRRLPRLSQAALESLAIIAFKGPIIRAEIEAIRGVNVEGVLKTLLERNLITVMGRQHAPGRPLLYGTTQDFLIYFGINSLSDLPQPKELEEIMSQEQDLFDREEVLVSTEEKHASQ
ncbi:MAG: SMC-Scp complex subunit ScpB [Gemmatimonadota bacterium]|nr:MAG: SMC-Scp complex subunit ScpB [Gemmatimonadota bacterium]